MRDDLTTTPDQDEVVELRDELARLYARLAAVETECANYRRRALHAIRQLDASTIQIDKLRDRIKAA